MNYLNRIAISIAALALASLAPAAIWYSSFTVTTFTTSHSRVDATGFPAPRQFFNIVDVTGIPVLRYIRIGVSATTCPMYRVVVRRGDFLFPGSPSYSFLVAPILQSALPGPPTVVLPVPATALFPGRWSVSVAMDTRFVTNPSQPFFFLTDHAWGFKASVETGQLLYTWESRGLFMQLSDSL